ncbi:MAG: ADP-ribosylglycohydrolase family protein, partial [Clostridia bacterium]|nr:ADP-ribosylglycohydrolase family protein [Clostridia bacterium]
MMLRNSFNDLIKRTACTALAALTVFSASGCANGTSSVTTEPSVDTTAPVTTEAVTLDPNAPNPDYPETAYRIISKEDYRSKTTAGFLSQLVGMVSGNEFATLSNGRCIVGLPDSWYEFLNGPYAGNTKNMKHGDKLRINAQTGINEVWMDDDFSVDVFNQYSLEKMYKTYGTVSAKVVSDGWIDYDIWDMGGGQKKVGAYGLINRNNFLPQFAGNTEYGNWYSYNTECYIATDTLGMSAAGMPEVAASLAKTFGQVTGDRDNLGFAQMFAAMISMAYFEDDIDTLIKEASKVFPDGAWQLDLIDELYALYAKYPSNWRVAYKELEKKYYVNGDTRSSNTTINCGFVILDLLYGKGDYAETCKIGSLAGYDCETTCGIALTVLSVMNGMDILPEDVNKVIWQDGTGVLVNRPIPGAADDVYMHAANLEERMKIADVVDKFIKNFESVLTENGGHIDDKYYYIPAEQLGTSEGIKIQNCGFESGTLDGFTVKGTAEISPLATMGLKAAKLTGETELYTTVSGLKVGSTYKLTVFVNSTETATTYIFARAAGGTGTCVSVNKTEGTSVYEAQKSVRRSLVFEATAEAMEIGVFFKSARTVDYAVVDQFLLNRIEETPVGTVTIKNEAANGVYMNRISCTVESETDKEAFIKLKFANSSSTFTTADITLNRKQYRATAFY